MCKNQKINSHIHKITPYKLGFYLEKKKKSMKNIPNKSNIKSLLLHLQSNLG